ncbi:MAG: acyltransferase [Gammaproteobacteria bacterium]|nr:MAG: acyltransferase [Gammaproteobacteria bacterium]
MGLIRGLTMLLFLSLNTIGWFAVTCVMAVIRFSVPSEPWRQRWGARMNIIIDGWIAGNRAMFALLGTMRLESEGGEGLTRDGWYLVVSNHQTWTDIFILQMVYGQRLPPLKFFMKQELIWLPLIGIACYALDFPFMRRYSREFLEQHPEYRGRDLETARQRCERFRPTPTAMLIFVEGTRFTPEKHRAQQSPYQHLLRPRAGGIGFVLGAMGDQLHGLVDTTILYPDGTPTFWQFLCGNGRTVKVDIEHSTLPVELTGGDYVRDETYRGRIQAWVDQLWRRKDARISTMMRSPEATAITATDV